MSRFTLFARIVAGVFFAMLASAGALFATDRDGEPANIMLPVGGWADFKIFPGSGASAGNAYFSIFTPPNTSIATIMPAAPFTIKGIGTWSVWGISPGATSTVFKADNTGPGVVYPSLSITVEPAAQTSANFLGTATAGDPVNTRNGELFGVENIDFNLGGPLPLQFVRFYASGLAADGKITSALGPNRTHNFDAQIVVTGQATQVRTSRGRVVYFESFHPNEWTIELPAQIPYQLVQNGTVFRYLDPASQTVEVFDTANGGHLTRIEDGKGNALALTYTSGLLTSVSDGVRTLTLGYNGGNQLTGVTDGIRSVAFAYDGNGNLQTATDVNSHTTTYAYNVNNFLTSGTFPLGNAPVSQVIATGTVSAQTQFTGTTTLVFTSTNSTVTDPTGATTTYNYSAAGQLLSMVDAAGKTIAMTSDAQGRRTSVTDRRGHTTTIAYDPASGLPTTVTRNNGETTTLAYVARTDTNGLVFYDLAKITNPEGTTESFAHDAHGNVTTATDVFGKKTTFTYNGHGQPLTITNALGGVTTFTYDANGRLLTSHDSDTQPTTFSYDSFGRIASVIYPIIGGTAAHRDFTYTNGDRYATVTDERGNTATFGYDNDDRLVATQDGALNNASVGYNDSNERVSFTNRRGKTSHRAYDTRGLLVSGTDPLGNATFSVYDSRRRLTSGTDATGIATTYGYDDEAELTSIADALNNTTSFQYSGSGAIKAVIDALQHVTAFDRNIFTHQTTTTDPLGRQVVETSDIGGRLIAAQRDGIPGASYTRDALGDVTQIKTPDGGVWKFSYTPMGRLKSETDPLGKTTSYTRDARGRVTKITHADGGTVTVNYDGANLITGATSNDAAGTAFTFSHDADGRLIGASDGVTADDVALTLDADGAITKSTQNGLDFDASYDDAGRLSSVSYASGAVTVFYKYDAAGRLKSVSDTLTSGTVGFTYDLAGRLSTITRPNGDNSTYNFDAAGNLTFLSTASFIAQYTYNAANEVTSFNFTPGIVGFATPSATPSAKNFKFNKVGEIVSVSGTAAVPPVAGNYGYDPRGRLGSSPGDNFVWDGFSRLTQVNDAFINPSVLDRRFSYNALGELVVRSENSISPQPTRFYHHQALGGSPIVAEYDPLASAFVRYYVFTPGGFLLYSIDAGTSAALFYQADRNGNVLALTGTGGVVADTYAYGPYGELLARTGTSDQPFRWLGAYGATTDALGTGTDGNASALVHIGARWYDPATARFLSRDPAGPRLDDVRTLDPYQYAFGDPATFIDITGARPERVSQVFLKSSLVEINRDDLNSLGVTLRQPQLIALPGSESSSAEINYLGVSPRGAIPCDPCCDPCDPCCYGPPRDLLVRNLSFYVQRVETENPFSSAIRENPAFQFINGGVQPGIANSSAFNYTPLFGSLGSTFLNKALAVPALSTQAGTGGGQSAEFSLDSVFIGPSERQLSPLRFGDLSDPSSGLSLRGSLRLGF